MKRAYFFIAATAIVLPVYASVLSDDRCAASCADYSDSLTVEDDSIAVKPYVTMTLMLDSVKTTDAYAMLDKSIYNMATVERQPFYFGGNEALQEWIDKNMNYPASAIENHTEGKIIIEFIIDENGGVCDAQILKGLTDELNDEALRLVNAMPDWRPGKVKGEAVKTYFTTSITFRLPAAAAD